MGRIDNGMSRRDAVRELGAGLASLAIPISRTAACPPSIPQSTAPSATDSSNIMQTACEIADAVRGHQASAVEVLEYYFDRIERLNPALNAFIYLDREGARKAARAIDLRIRRREDPGPLAGVPFGVKDLHECSGMPNSRGSLLYKDSRPAERDSAPVGRARRAGAVPVGKTAAPEFGLHSITWSLAWGTTRNPWDLTQSPGGSSGGSSAAVAAGLVPLAGAGDGGGSTRSPAAFAGLVGLKPSHGRIGRDSVSDTSVAGCLSLTVRDTARHLDVVAGPTPSDRTSLPPSTSQYEQIIETLDVAGLRVAWSDDLGFAPTESECISVARKAAETLVRAGRLLWVDRSLRLPNIYAAWLVSAVTNLRGDLEADGIWPDKVDQLTPRVRERAALADQFGRADVARAQRRRQEIESVVGAFFEDVDVLMTPVTTVVSLPAEGPIPSLIAGLDARNTGAEAHLQLANVCWLPAISVPAGLSSSGFPIGLQIVCGRWRDDVALRLARILEQAEPWPHRAPAYRIG